jgi:hypothetical protein
VTLACFANERTDQGVDYLRRQAMAARKAGSFHEYWTWDAYTGASEPGGAPLYGETSAGYLDALLHGLFGLSPAHPGYMGVRLAPRFPDSWDRARLGLRLPCGQDLAMEYEATKGGVSVRIELAGTEEVEIALPGRGGPPPRVEGESLLRSRVQGEAGSYRITAHVRGTGLLRLS